MAELQAADDSVAERNEALFKLYIQIAMLNGNKIMYLIGGHGVAPWLVKLPGLVGALKDEPFYKIGNHGTLPVYEDKSLGAGDVLVVCKKGVEKIRLTDLEA